MKNRNGEIIEVKKAGEVIEVTCPVSGKKENFVIIGRNFCFEYFESYMVGRSEFGRVITTVNHNGVSQFPLF